MTGTDLIKRDRKLRRRAASEFLTLVLFFGIVYTGALLAHGYGL